MGGVSSASRKRTGSGRDRGSVAVNVASDSNKGPDMKSFFVLLISFMLITCGAASAPAQEPLPKEQADAVAAIKKLGGSVYVDAISVEVLQVYLRGPKVTDAGLEHLKGLTSLTELVLQSEQITDVGLEQLKGLTGLTELNLGNTKITDAGLAEIKAALPKCKVVK